MEVVGPKWEELNMDCLANIFARVGMESLLLDVPYVCKSWYKAACNPQCWSVIDFEETLDSGMDLLFLEGFPCRLVQTYRLYQYSSRNEFIKYVAQRGNKFASYIKLPDCCTPETLVFISNECTNLQTLKLTSFWEDPSDLASILPSVLSKCKRLENLSFHDTYVSKNMFETISIHCKGIATLEVFNCHICEGEASALIRLPNLKSLSIRYAHIRKEHLLMIVKGCKRLEYLDAMYCVGFDEDDAEIVGSTSHTLSVRLHGSSSYKFVDDEEHDDEYYYHENDNYGDSSSENGDYEDYFDLLY